MAVRRSSSSYIGQGSTRVVACVLLAWLVQLQRSDMVALCAGIPSTVITCDAGTFYVAQNATVTCNFPMDVGAKRGEVIVERSPRNASKEAIRKDTLSCGWVEQEQNPACIAAPGFEFDGNITRHLTIVIPDVSEEYAGTYVCFLVSEDGTTSEKCGLTVKERSTTSTVTTTTVSTIVHSHGPDGSSSEWVIPLLIVISVTSLVVTVVAVLLFCRIKRKKSTRGRHPTDVIMDGVEAKLLNPALPRSEIAEKHLKCFELSTENVQQVTDGMAEEMNKCPTDNTDTGIMQPPMFLHTLPKGKEKGYFIVVDLSGIVLKIYHVKLRDPEPVNLCRSFPIPVAVRLGTGIQLFDFIADSVHTVLRELDIMKKRRHVAFVVSFPCDYERNLTSARLIKCTSAFQCEDLVGKDVQEMLQQSFDRKIPECCLDVTVTIDDTAAVLMSVLDNNPSCRIAVTLDNGFHACYLEEKDIGSSHSGVESKVIVIADLGALGENECLDMLKTDYDKVLDEYFIHPKKQTLEKMVSVAYIGEQLRLVLAALVRKGLLFKSVPIKSVLNQKDCFTADYVSLIESDDCNLYGSTAYVLRQLQLENSTGNCKIVYDICKSILKRAAHLAAAGLAALINRLDTADDDVTIAVDGALSRYHPHFYQLLCDKTQELVPQKKVKLVPSLNGSVMGAALTTAVLKPHRKVETVMKGFMLTMLDCERVCTLLHRELALSATTDSTEHIKQSLPKGTETGDFVSVRLGIDGVDIQFVHLSGAKTDVQSKIYDLPTDSTADEAIQAEETDSMSFFSLVAEAVKQFVQSHHLSEKAIPSEFVFCTPSGFDDDVTFDHLTNYTKGYFCENDKDKDATDSLQHILRKINATRRVKIKPTIKDPVGTLLSGVYENQACNAAFLYDAKLTACYVPKQTRDQKEVEFTIIEWGAIGDKGCLDVFRTEFDMMLDGSSENPRENIMEKMISWRHLGEIVRLVLLELVKEDLLSMSVPDNSALRETSGFTARHLLLIESDVEAGHTNMTKFVLDELQVQNHTTEDDNNVRNVCKTICERSACLTAAALAALITFLNQSDVTIAVNGNRDHPKFQQTLEDKTKEIVKEKFKRFKLLPQYNGRRVGAAVAAVLCNPTRRKKTNPRNLASRKQLVKLKIC